MLRFLLVVKPSMTASKDQIAEAIINVEKGKEKKDGELRFEGF